MKNKRLLIILSFLVIFLAIILLCSNIFSLKTVNIDIENNSTFSTQTQSEICTQNIFKYNQSIFFFNKSNITSKLEQQYPLLKINSIETIFPNKLFIHASERKEVFYVKNSQNLFVSFDQTFKALKTYTTAPQFTQVTGINAENATVGNQLNKTSAVNLISDFYYNMYLAYYDEESFVKFIKRCEVSENSLNIITKMSGDVGLTIKIENPCSNLTKKVVYALSAYNALSLNQKEHGNLLIQEHLTESDKILTTYQE